MHFRSLGEGTYEFCDHFGTSRFCQFTLAMSLRVLVL